VRAADLADGFLRRSAASGQQAAWDGVERVRRAVVLCRKPVSRPTLRGVRADL